MKVFDSTARLKTSQKGLTEKEVKKRLLSYGYNELQKKRKLSPLWQFFSYFKNPLVIILIIAALISGAVGEMKNFVIILVMVLLSVTLNFYQEHKSSQAAEKIAKKLMLTATVVRDGREQEVEIKYLVPGDLILFSAGDVIPADGLVVEADDFFVNESALTGESFPVEKTAAGRKNNLIYSGTVVISGYASAVITKTGAKTEYGTIAERLNRQEAPSAFEIGIKKFGFLIIRVIVAIVLVIFIINAIKGKDLVGSLIFSIAIAVGVTPELLPMIISINMAKGVNSDG